jgi:predicted O-methyltransferase YrrM
VNIANALPIEGWMKTSELEWLAQQASQNRRIVEVGSWMGRSTTSMADNMEGGVIFAVDTWRGSEEHESYLKDKPVDFVYETFRANLKRHIDSGRVCPVRLPSLEAARVFRALGCPGFDMVFIDAAHDYENVKADIQAWKPLVRPGGLLCGHDWGHPPIVQAVRELLGKPKSSSTIWYARMEEKEILSLR